MKKMSAYPRIIDINELERLYRRLLKDDSVVFVQAKVCADYVERHPVDEEDPAEFTGWTNWIHLKGGVVADSPAQSIFRFLMDDEDYEISNLMIFDIEWMRRDKELHSITVLY